MKTPTLSAHALCPTPLGELLLGATAHGLAGAWFIDGQRDTPATEGWSRADPAHPVLAEAARQFGDYFAGRRPRFDLPLDLSAGTPFQQDVWRALLGIAGGDARTYGEVAARIGRPAAVRAVGTAVGANPLIIVVPCHRVLGSQGALTGFGGGLGRKAALLRLEGWRLDGFESSTPDAALRRLRPRRPAAEQAD
ncbi:MAG: methylated-DNA--[protein]-cysteine S-methyltransferase [Ottowia sp.]|uniref:methylated-DNA--[protein]-cysteine S-methyltransferase n=1 Tax=Ottowia sp. TaxID=1898956 RepID=UPI0039E6EAAB